MAQSVRTRTAHQPPRASVRFLPILVLIGLTAALAEEPANKNRKQEDKDQIAAVVDGEPILLRDVEREISFAFGQRPIAAESIESIRRATLEQLIRRRLILRWLAETKQAASPMEVDSAILELKAKLESRGDSLDDFLQRQQLDDAGLKRSVAWQIGWQRFLERQLTDENLEKYFARHRPEFDGTEVRVAQLFLKVGNTPGRENIQDVLARAEKLVADIRGGNLSFAEAVKAHSESPSREQGGDIGFIRRREPMPEAFSKAAFSLEPKQISDPVVTPLGVHIIQCLEIKPGNRTWEDARDELKQGVTAYLFEWASDQVRSRAKIEYGWK